MPEPLSKKTETAVEFKDISKEKGPLPPGDSQLAAPVQINAAAASSRPVAPPVQPRVKRARIEATSTPRLFRAAHITLHPEEVEEFLSYVAEGHQDNAEAMLKKNPKLVLARGSCKDFGGRTFKNITGFQYALWALDWHMWDMILGYLDKVDLVAAREQCREQEAVTEASGHGAHYNFGEFISALKNYVDKYEGLYRASKWDDLARLWIDGVGSAQKNTVAHVAQEYCHPDRSFDPVPDFTKKPLKRQFKMVEGEWRTTTDKSGRFGKNPQSSSSFFAILRSNAPHAFRAKRSGTTPAKDYKALLRLHEVRTSQLKETQAYLLNHGARPGARS